MRPAERESETRFRFGENWKRFLELVDRERIAESERSLSDMLGVDSLAALSFLDIGSGSGLSSLAARNLGARVRSFDYDPSSVWCTSELRRRFRPDDADWAVSAGSVLDPGFMRTLPEFDVVYSWGVLHHTGDMRGAIRAAAAKVRPGGLLFLALYRKTVLCWAWAPFKKYYAASSPRTQDVLQRLWILKTRAASRVKRRNFDELVSSYRKRGMDFYRDVHDWLGGYPYESITPRACRELMDGLGFTLVREKILTDGISIALSSGCDEYVFTRCRQV